MKDEVDSNVNNKNSSFMESSNEKPQTKLSRFISDSREKVNKFSSQTYTKLEPVITILKNKYVRYSISIFLLGAVVALYVLYETYPGDENTDLRASLVPIGLVLALILVFYISWADPKFKKYRTPGVYVVILTAIFYAFIFTDISELLFRTTLARWLTRSTGFLTSSIVMGFGIHIDKITWTSFITSNGTEWRTQIDFLNAPSGQGSLFIDAACSGIHSLTVFAAVFLLMLFESRKRHKWNPMVAVVTLIGILGTYIMNLIRIMIIISLYYYQGPSIAEPVHNYLGYVILIVWLPIFWLYILPLAETKEMRQERKLRKAERRKERRAKKSKDTEKL